MSGRSAKQIQQTFIPFASRERLRFCMRPSLMDRRTMPRDELVALVLGGYMGYTVWRAAKAFVEGIRSK